MSKVIIPKRLIVELETDGTAKSVALQYQLSIDGVTDPRKMLSVNVDQGITFSNLNSVTAEAKASAEQSEGV